VVTNDPKGIGALLLAATEMETIAKKGWRRPARAITIDPVN
jgi:hypothetical protein